MLDQIQELLDNYDKYFKELDEHESWTWALNEMSDETNELFGKALKQIEFIKTVIKDAKNNKSN